MGVESIRTTLPDWAVSLYEKRRRVKWGPAQHTQAILATVFRHWQLLRRDAGTAERHKRCIQAWLRNYLKINNRVSKVNSLNWMILVAYSQPFIDCDSATFFSPLTFSSSHVCFWDSRSSWRWVGYCRLPLLKTAVLFQITIHCGLAIFLRWDIWLRERC